MQVEDVRQSIGKQAGVSDWLTVTQELIDEFASLTGDRQWIHVDSNARPANPLSPPWRGF